MYGKQLFPVHAGSVQNSLAGREPLIAEMNIEVG
jgi:hypothetical protein